MQRTRPGSDRRLRVVRVAGACFLAGAVCGVAAPIRVVAVAETEPAAAELEAVESPPAGVSQGSVARSAFTTEVIDREPQDSLETLPAGVGRVHYFTELRDLEGETVIHRWSFDGAVMAEVSFAVAGPRWRVHSSKRVDPSLGGTWTVSVLDGAGNLLAEDRLLVVAPGSAASGDTGEPAPSADR